MSVWVITENGEVESVWAKERAARAHLAELEAERPGVEFRLTHWAVRW